MNKDVLGLYVVIAPNGKIYARDVLAKDADEALHQCVSEANPKIKEYRISEMIKEGWIVKSKFRWQVDELSREK